MNQSLDISGSRTGSTNSNLEVGYLLEVLTDVDAQVAASLNDELDFFFGIVVESAEPFGVVVAEPFGDDAVRAQGEEDVLTRKPLKSESPIVFRDHAAAPFVEARVPTACKDLEDASHGCHLDVGDRLTAAIDDPTSHRLVRN